ncbi:preprotein translocase subunit YajC [Sulfuriflexus sp.]|uniref:preprotein translocase subunit YajC n=1 Tax=Sulfuriflexus sp. TaxID=2015443 RepID=UPI0028CE8B52|nr:preprotein translocase subunit YajC [Sulfuriflexus sp.]MDT8404046.1 preprotein translocase subunit YajC [Sulfuriflexus sp.]
MSFFISEALAEGNGQAATQGDPMTSLIFMVVIFAVFYFLLIRPQAKRAKQHRQLVASLSKGDEVLTSGGIYGKLSNVADDHVDVDIADGTTIKVQRQAVASVLPKGTIKSL